MKNTSLHLYDILLVVILLLVLTCFSSCKKKTEENSEPPKIDVAEAISDSVVIYETYPGIAEASQKVDVVARVNGKILSINFNDGQYVTKGTVLFTIESNTYRDAVNSSEAALNTARSQYQYYSKQYEAMKRALQGDAVSKMEVLQAESNMKQAQASIQSASAALSTARTNLNNCIVRAPLSGFITTPAFSAGATVYGEASPVVLTTIYDNSSLVAHFSLSDAKYESILAANGGIANKVYRNVPITFREKLPHSYSCDLYYTAPTVNESTGTISLEGKLINVNNEIKNGMYINVSLPLGSNPNAVLVKDAAISTDQRGKYLYTVNDSNKIVYTPIEVGQLYHDSLRVVNSGIQKGDRYVTKALLTVRPGEKIRPVLTK